MHVSQCRPPRFARTLLCAVIFGVLNASAEFAVAKPLSCTMQKSLVLVSAARREQGASRAAVEKTLRVGGDLTPQEVQYLAGLVYVELRRMSPGPASEVAFNLCEASAKKLADAAALAAGEDPKTAKLSCYDVGYRYGVTATRSMRDLPTNDAWDFVAPARCHSAQSFDVGILAGTKAASRK